MAHSDKNKKQLLYIVLYSALALATMLVVLTIQYRAYSAASNRCLNAICIRLTEKYPELTTGEIVDLLNGPGTADRDLFAKYGIDIEKESLLAVNRANFTRFTLIDIGIALIFLLFAGVMAFLMQRQDEKHIKAVTWELSHINKGDYNYDMTNVREGSLSILENELYKTAIMLKESAENSRKDKEMLKDSLSDISHQLKTPLTSLMINLDNLEENPDISEDKRAELLGHAKRDVNRINLMVRLLLKLSRFDANAVEFEQKETKLEDIVRAAVDNVDALCDLKGIKLLIEDYSESEAIIICDPYWETEALTNILKNGVEHAKSCVKVGFRNCSLYSEITVENDGSSISDEDARNAFNRFYRGADSTADSVGIGLALADSIVKTDGGYIVAEGTEFGTKFTIRYTG